MTIIDPSTATDLPTWIGWVGGAGGMVAQWIINRRGRERDKAENNAEISSYRADSAVTDAAASQVKSLLDRVDMLEQKYYKLWDDMQVEKASSSKLRARVTQLEGILRGNNIQIPPEV